MSLEVCHYKGLVVNFEYDPGEEKTWDDPGSPECVYLSAVYANGMDILDFIDESIIEDIESVCLASVEKEVYNSEYDSADLYYQSRKDDMIMESL